MRWTPGSLETRQKRGDRTEGDSATAQKREPVGLGGDERPALDSFKNAANQARAKGPESTYSASRRPFRLGQGIEERGRFVGSRPTLSAEVRADILARYWTGRSEYLVSL